MEKCWIIAWIPHNFCVSKSFPSFNTLIKRYPNVYLLFLVSKHEIGPRTSWEVYHYTSLCNLLSRDRTVNAVMLIKSPNVSEISSIYHIFEIF